MYIDYKTNYIRNLKASIYINSYLFALCDAILCLSAKESALTYN